MGSALAIQHRTIARKGAWPREKLVFEWGDTGLARALRSEPAGGLYQLTARGDRREAIYFSVEDREAWLSLLPKGDLREVPRARCRPILPRLSDHAARAARRRAMAQACLSGNFNRKEIAEYFGVHRATVSRAVGAHERAVKNDV